jgi:hypothetical protein
MGGSGRDRGRREVYSECVSVQGGKRNNLERGLG